MTVASFVYYGNSKNPGVHRGENCDFPGSHHLKEHIPPDWAYTEERRERPAVLYIYRSGDSFTHSRFGAPTT